MMVSRTLLPRKIVLSAAHAMPPPERHVGFQRINFDYECGQDPCHSGDTKPHRGRRNAVMRVFYPTVAPETGRDPAKDRYYEACRQRIHRAYPRRASYPWFALFGESFEAFNADLNDWLMCDGDDVRVTASENVPIAGDGSDRFHVVFFSSGAGGYSHVYTGYVRHLVKNGFVVVLLEHPYFDRVAQLDDERNVDGWPQPPLGKELPRLRGYVRDAQEARIHLGGLNNARFQGSLVLDRVGYMGHSMGGTAATLAANKDPHFVAAVNLDGRLETRDDEDALWNVGEGLTSPWMFINSAAFPLLHYAQTRFAPSNRNPMWMTVPHGVFFYIDGTKHQSLSDSCDVDVEAYAQRHPTSGINPRQALKDDGLCGSADPQQVRDVVNRYATAFFKQHLVGVPQPLLTETPRDPLVKAWHSWQCDPNTPQTCAGPVP